MKGRSLSGYQQKRVWLNDGAGRFTDVAQVVGVTERYDGRAVALADLWNRGVLDVDRRQPARAAARLQEHASQPGQRTGSTSSSRARRSNRSAIGAEVRAVLERPGAGAGGLAAAAASARRTSAALHFGLGQGRHASRRS